MRASFRWMSSAWVAVLLVACKGAIEASAERSSEDDAAAADAGNGNVDTGSARPDGAAGNTDGSTRQDAGVDSGGPNSGIGGIFDGGPDASSNTGTDAGTDAGTDSGPQACTMPSGCADGLFCTGVETCTNNVCVNGAAPCSGMVCVESTDSCANANGSTMIKVDDTQIYQTIHGWEATAQAGQDPKDVGAVNYRFPEYQDELIDRTVNELGITRVRLSVRAGAENSQANWQRLQNGTITLSEYNANYRYLIENDDNDPNVITAAGFHFEEIDHYVNTVVLPMKQKLEARGEKLHISLNYVNKLSNGAAATGTTVHTINLDEYAEFMLATVQHLKSTFNFVPDTIEPVLEPDNTADSGWHSANGGTNLGSAIVKTNARLVAAGFAGIKYVGPSTTAMDVANTYFDQMIAVSGVTALMYELSYHRYKGVSGAALTGIAQRAVAAGISTGMLEYNLGAEATFLEDLTTGRNSAFQQFTLAYPSPNGPGVASLGVYFSLDMTNSPVVILPTNSSRTYRQYFMYARPGATVIGTSITGSGVSPIAFKNTNGKQVVVVKTTGAKDFSVAGLAAGTYGINYSTATAYNTNATDVAISAGQLLPVSMPGAGVITVYGK